ncbi:hypothetical protein C8Q70DRAFT_1055947 [Cubamyces menziesii]|nr:hypothetical protein C8Q70DRAFT_1055947 [Cubamyces menziesii]
MDKFATLEPVRLHHHDVDHHRKPLPTSAPAPFQVIGRLPADVHISVLSHLAIPHIPAYARCSRALARLARDERVWEARWLAFGVDRLHLRDVLDALEDQTKVQNALDRGHAPPTLQTESLDDEFGDFASVNAQADEMGDFVGGGSGGTFSLSMSISPPIPAFS